VNVEHLFSIIPVACVAFYLRLFLLPSLFFSRWPRLLTPSRSLLQVYATSEPFEIKALGSAYPSQASGTSGNVTASSTGSAAASTHTSGALDMGAGFGGVFAGALAAAAAMWA
jgi:hypothetical protein